MAGACRRLSQTRLSLALTAREVEAFFQVTRQHAAIQQRDVGVALPDADIQQASAKQGHIDEEKRPPGRPVGRFSICAVRQIIS